MYHLLSVWLMLHLFLLRLSISSIYWYNCSVFHHNFRILTLNVFRRGMLLNWLLPIYFCRQRTVVSCRMCSSLLVNGAALRPASHSRRTLPCCFVLSILLFLFICKICSYMSSCMLIVKMYCHFCTYLFLLLFIIFIISIHWTFQVYISYSVLL